MMQRPFIVVGAALAGLCLASSAIGQEAAKRPAPRPSGLSEGSPSAAQEEILRSAMLSGLRPCLDKPALSPTAQTEVVALDVAVDNQGRLVPERLEKRSDSSEEAFGAVRAALLACEGEGYASVPGREFTAMTFRLVVQIPDAMAAPQITSKTDREAVIGELRRIRTCWNVSDIKEVVPVTMAFTLARDGRVVEESMRRTAPSETSETVLESEAAARRAILRCQGAGYELPATAYDLWRNVEMTFALPTGEDGGN